MICEVPLRVLLIGSGGREHALAWKLSQSPLVESIIAVPGNGGTARCAKTRNVDDSPSSSSSCEHHLATLLRLAREHAVNYVVPGPEAPLVAGAVDFFERAGLPCFGPSRRAARLEGSKTFSKDFMRRHGIPTAAYENFSEYGAARRYLDAVDHAVVIKASGLAAGKGVIMPASKDEAQKGLEAIMLAKEFGSAGDEVVIEELLEGNELSLLTFSDGYSFKSLPLAQDHKRIGDGDTGLNTGGMGCYAPTNIATPHLIEQIDRLVLQPTFSGMVKDQMPFKGVLFTGLMITSDGPKVLEYNVRFGDPETQTVLPLLSHDTDLAKIMIACTETYLGSPEIVFKVEPRFSTTVVIAAGGYPEKYGKGDEITVQEPADDIHVFHAGTKFSDGKLQTAGGRVIAATATGPSLRAAVDRAYHGVGLIHFKNKYCRTDIAHRGLRATDESRQALTYEDAGVSITGGNHFVEVIRNAVRSTARPGARAEIGGFGGEVDLCQAGFSPVPLSLVGAIDGVGTKLMVANAMKNHTTVGIDLVAMNVNDLVVQGAVPLMFLDYIGLSRLNQTTAATFVQSVAKGCIEAGCALAGGETAEMPGMYKGDDYDAAGAAIGVLEPANRLPRDTLAAGDVLLGLASTGVHSNGFSLVRRIVERERLPYSGPAPWDPSGAVSLGDSLLTPTRIYVRPLLRTLPAIKALAHITGGGLRENVPRMLSRHDAVVDVAAWPLPPVFRWLKTAGNVAAAEMARTFNVGVGMVAAVAAADAAGVCRSLEGDGITVYTIGCLTDMAGEAPVCVLRGLESWDE